MNGKPRVVIHVAKGVSFRADVLVGDEVDVFCVDENVPGDRVFRYTPNSVPAEIDEVLGGSTIGHSGDERHAWLKNVAALVIGEPPEKH